MNVCMKDVAFLDLCSHPTLPASESVGSQTDEDSADDDNVSVSSVNSTQVIIITSLNTPFYGSVSRTA